MVATLGEWSRELALDLFTAMAQLRAFDERAVILQRQGRIGTYPTFYGEEAVQAASVRALRSGDWLFPTYRQTAVVTLRGCPPLVPLLMWRGHPGGWHDVMEYRVAPICVPVATNLPHAVGAAWGAQLRHLDLVSLAYGGDGATSAGDFHEACNLAGRMQAPVVFLVQNNGWAISTPRRLQSAAPSLALRAPGYGFPGVRVDGNDLLAVHQAAAAAVARARAGAGPTLIEADTYRFGFHNTTDNPAAYADPRELAAARLRDPIERVRRYLTQRGAWDAAREAAVQERLTAALDAAVDAAARLPPPRPDECFDDIYGRPPARFLRQRAGGAAAPEA